MVRQEEEVVAVIIALDLPVAGDLAQGDVHEAAGLGQVRVRQQIGSVVRRVILQGPPPLRRTIIPPAAAAGGTGHPATGRRGAGGQSPTLMVEPGAGGSSSGSATRRRSRGLWYLEDLPDIGRHTRGVSRQLVCR